MTSKDRELLQKLLVTFKVEAEDHLRGISSNLAKLEQLSSPEEQLAAIEHMFREAHSLKGAARAVNLETIEATCQQLETLLAKLKARELSVSRDVINELYRIFDILNTALLPTGFAQTTAQQPAEPAKEIVTLPQAKAVPPESTLTTAPTVPTALAAELGMDLPLVPTLRVSTLKLDALFRQTEELIPAKTVMAQRVAESREIQEILNQWLRQWRTARPLTRLSAHSERPDPQSDHFRRVLDLNEKTLELVRTKVACLAGHLSHDGRWFDRRIDDLVEDIKRISMVPFSTLLESFHRLVRDLCRDCGKEAELVMTGVDIEADRRVLEQMKDPLVHLVRNAIDHGIEAPSVRIGLGKPSRAAITIAVTAKDGGKVEIKVSDDGAGIDASRVCRVAFEAGQFTPADQHKMDEKHALSLIFESGVSTSATVTEVSGRGLGLAIVREKVEKVGGTVSVETQPGFGTSFRLLVPLTLARFRGIIVRVGDRNFVLPTIQVLRVLRVTHDDIKSVENRDVIAFNGGLVSALRLADALEITPQNLHSESKRKMPAVVLGWAGERVAFLVDEIVDEQEVVVRSLGRQFPSVRNIAGATILGTGKVVPVLNVADLIQSAVSLSPATVHEAEEEPKYVLVAEDSITARSLLKNILESAGYGVKTAVDGADALSILERENFDLIVSDVDMPRMNGFDLTTKIRQNRNLTNLPVILVTALDSAADRERGADVGANAYIVKGSFDQNNLLEMVKRLI